MVTKKEQVIAIATDVIAQIDHLGAIVQGRYCHGDIDSVHLNKNPQEVIDDIAKRCAVCALGACFLSSIRLYDKITMPELTKYSEYRKIYMFGCDLKLHLAQFFTPDQICLIEAAFEWFEVSAMKPAHEFGRRYPDGRTRLKAIMQNIIDNDGEFKP